MGAVVAKQVENYWAVEEPGLALGTAGLVKACAMHPVSPCV